MNIKHLLATAAVLSMAVFSSCSKESTGNGMEQELGHVTFKVSIPKGDPVTYTTHDAEEYGIESLWLYEFDGNTEKLLSNPINIASQLQGVGPTFTYTKEIDNTNKGVRRFVFVANEAPDASMTEGKTLTFFNTIMAQKEQEEDTKCDAILNEINSKQRIPMTGVAVQNGSELIAITGAPGDVTVDMVRIVARIDIENNIEGFTIEQVTLSRTNKKSFLLPGNYFSSKPDRTSGVLPFNSLPSPFDKGKTMTKAFYLYESVHGSEFSDTPTIDIIGKLSGHTVHYAVPFFKDGGAGVVHTYTSIGGEAIDVKRNHIYHVQLGDGSNPIPGGSGKIKFSIKDTPWNEVTMNQQFSIISLSKTSGAHATFNPSTNSLEADNSEQEVEFKIATNFASPLSDYNIDKSSGWLWPSDGEYTFSTDTFKIHIAANDSGMERNDVVVLYNSLDEEAKVYIKIKQKP